jgi:hypothetical protein
MEPMTITISYTAFLLTIVAVVGVAALVYFMAVLAKISRLAERLDTVIGQAGETLGAVRTLADESTDTVVKARHLLEQGSEVVGDFSAVSARMRDLAESDAMRALSLIERLKSFMAIFAGVKTAFASVKHFMERRRHPAEGSEVN